MCKWRGIWEDQSVHIWANLYSILKSRDIALPTKVRLVKAIVFPVVMYGCEGWSVKKAECLRIDDFELWCWRRLFRVPWISRRSNWSILKDISPGCSLEGLMLKLKLQYFCHLMRRVDSLEKSLMLGGVGGQEEKGTKEDEMAGWHHRLDACEFGWTPGLGDGHELRAAIHGVTKSQTWLSDWTELKWVNLWAFEHICVKESMCQGPGQCICVRAYWEDVTTGWQVSWTQAVRGSSLPPLSLECRCGPQFPY